MRIEFEKSLEDIRKVDPNRNYWFIRTYGGETYNDFKAKGYVGIGFNDVPYKYIKSAKPDFKTGYDKLKEYLENNHNYEGGTLTKWTNQLISFEHDIKTGDIVIIPDTNSMQFCIGEITSNTVIVEDNRTFQYREKYEKYPEKRKKVNWLREIEKRGFQGELSGLTSSHQAVTNANRFREAIEGRISSLFTIGDVAHLLIFIGQDEDINAFQFRNFLDGLTYFYQEIVKEKGDEADEELYIKIKVQSKGSVALKATAVAGLLGLATIFALSDDPEVKLELMHVGSIEAKGGGLLKSWAKFLDANEERKKRMMQFQDSLDNLKAQREYKIDSLNDQSGN